MSKVIQGLSKKERKKLIKEIYNKINIEVGEVEGKIKEASPLYNYWESDGDRSILDDIVIKEDRYKETAEKIIKGVPLNAENFWNESMIILWKKEKAAEYGLTDVFDDIKEAREKVTTIIQMVNTPTKLRSLQLIVDNNLMQPETLTRFKQSIYNSCDTLKDDDGFKLASLCMDNDIETLYTILDKEISKNTSNEGKGIKVHIRDTERKQLKELIEKGDPFHLYRGFLVEQDEYIRMGKKEDGSDYWKQDAGKGLSYSLSEDVAGYFCYWNLTYDETGNCRDEEYSITAYIPPSIVTRDEYIKHQGEVVSKRIDNINKKPIICKLLCDPNNIKGYSFEIGEGEVNLFPEELVVERYEIVPSYKIAECMWNKIQRDKEFIWELDATFNPNGIVALSIDKEDGGKEVIFADGKQVNEKIIEHKEQVINERKTLPKPIWDKMLYDIWSEFAIELPDEIDPIILTKELYWLLTNPYNIKPKFKQGNIIKRSYKAVQHYMGIGV